LPRRPSLRSCWPLGLPRYPGPILGRHRDIDVIGHAKPLVPASAGDERIERKPDEVLERFDALRGYSARAVHFNPDTE
jgi:hypothetical protein